MTDSRSKIYLHQFYELNPQQQREHYSVALKYIVKMLMQASATESLPTLKESDQPSE